MKQGDKMTNDDVIIIRARDFKMAPDVEIYIQKLFKDGVLSELSKQRDLNVGEIKKMPLGKVCDIFEQKPGMDFMASDILINGETGTFEIFTGGI